MTDSNAVLKTNLNGLEGKTPFLIGVAGGTASGKVTNKKTPIVHKQTKKTITEHCLQENHGKIRPG